MKKLIVLLMLTTTFFASSNLIPREELFSKQECVAIKIAPTGEKIAYVGNDQSKVLNIFLALDLSLENARQITFFEDPEIRQIFWTQDAKKILILKNKDGTAQLQLYGVDIETEKLENYTKGFPPVVTKIFKVCSYENKAVIGLNHRRGDLHDLYLIDFDSGETSLIFENDHYVNFLFDEELNIILKMALNLDGSWTIFDKEDQKLMSIDPEDAFHTEFLSYDQKNEEIYFLDNRFTNTTELKSLSLKDGEENVLGHEKESDINDLIFQEGKPIAYATYHVFKKWHALSPSIEKDLKFLEEKLGPNFSIASQSSDVWVISTNLPEKGIQFWSYHRENQTLENLYSVSGSENFSQMYPIVCKARDGMELVNYLTLPRDVDREGRVSTPIPLVVIPHGGPFKVRDYYCFHPFHQWLASRGYAVLSVNFRLSSGFGKELVNAGNGQWGGKAHEDVIDVISDCIKNGITEKGKIAVFGGSYGGYEALAGLTFTPEFFTCGVSLCGPSNLKTVLGSCPFYWERPAGLLSDKHHFFTRQAFIMSMGGDPKSEEGSQYLEKCSPLNYIDQIQKPLLLIHGENDPIVSGKESDQIFTKMSEKKMDVEYLSFPDEGHGIKKYPNMMYYLETAEKFLAKHLHGKHEPLAEEIKNQSTGVMK